MESVDEPCPDQSAVDEAAPRYRLHSPFDVVLATFLGTPFAGGVVLGINYFKLGRRVAGWQAILLGMLATALLIVGGFKLRLPAPGFAIGLVVLAVMYFLAERLQGEMYRTHLQDGGKKASSWIAAGIGIGNLAVFFVAIFGWSLSQYGLLASRVEFGPGEEVIYGEGATEQQARKMGELLQKVQYFKGDRARTVRITHDGNLAIVEFVYKKEACSDPKIAAWMEKIKPLLSKEVFDGRPVQIRLDDEGMHTQKTI